jgi:hypothetical protein
MEEIKYGQLWARHSELVEADQVGKYRVNFEGLKKAVEEAMRIQQPNEQPVEQKENEVAIIRWLREEGWEPRNHTGWAKNADNESYYLTDKEIWNEYQKQNKR